MTTNEMIQLVHLGSEILALCEQASKGPWQLKEHNQHLCLTTPEPWRVRFKDPRRDRTVQERVAEHRADIGEVYGRLSEMGRANGELMAAARDALPLFINAFIKLATEKVQREGEAAALRGKLAEELQVIAVDEKVRDFHSAIADALDDLFEAARLFRFVSNRDQGEDGVTRLLCECGRDERWEVLSALADVLDPAKDRERMAKLPPALQLPVHAQPKRIDFIEAMPEQIRAGLRGEQEPTTAQVEAEIEQLGNALAARKSA